MLCTTWLRCSVMLQDKNKKVRVRFQDVLTKKESAQNIKKVQHHQSILLDIPLWVVWYLRFATHESSWEMRLRGIQVYIRVSNAYWLQTFAEPYFLLDDNADTVALLNAAAAIDLPEKL